ncbi:sialate O-acetylesterase, partial [Ruminiclostridium cellobioparum]
TDVKCSVSGVSGKHDLYLKYTGGSGYLFNLNWFTFSNEPVEPVSKLGDINSDGQIDSIDLQLIKAYLLGLGTIENTKAGDLDASGEINAIDFSLMKQYLLGIISTFPGQNTDPENPKFHCFLLLGQSNMAGYPKAQDSDKVEDPRVLVLGYDNNSALGRVTDQWDVACPPLHEAWNGAIGPGDWFGKTLIQKVPEGDTIGLIPCAISGEKIETFMKSGGSKYNWIINRAKLAQQKGGIIEGIIFHQGESNSGDTSWPGKVKTLVEDLRKDLNLGNVPFLAGELLYSGPCAGHNTLVNQLPSIISNCYVVSANGLVVDSADTQYRLHFGHDSQVTFGKRYAEKMIQALDW